MRLILNKAIGLRRPGASPPTGGRRRNCPVGTAASENAAPEDQRLANTIESAAPLPLLAEPLQDLIDPLDDQLQRLVGHLEVRMRANVGVDLVK